MCVCVRVCHTCMFPAPLWCHRIYTYGSLLSDSALCFIFPSSSRSSDTRFGASSSTNRSGALRLRQVESGFKAHPGTIWSCVLCPNTSRQTVAVLCCPTRIITKKPPKSSSFCDWKSHTRIRSNYDRFFFSRQMWLLNKFLAANRSTVQTVLQNSVK